jgi:hypothetical protein
MLTKIKRLSVEVEGRHATADELRFLHDYLDGAGERLALYEKLQGTIDKLDRQIEIEIEALDPNIYRRGERDISAICKRDRQNALRCISIATLFDDLERLRDDFLVWDSIVVKAFQDGRAVNLTYQVMARVLENLLDADEYALISEALQLTRTTLVS